MEHQPEAPLNHWKIKKKQKTTAVPGQLVSGQMCLYQGRSQTVENDANAQNK